MSVVENIVKEALSKISNRNPQSITDDVFKAIENDKKILEQYHMYLAGGNKQLAGKNSRISAMITVLLNLKSTENNNKKPESKLIQAHKKLEQK